MDYVLRLTEPDEYDDTLQLFTDEEEFTAYLEQVTEMAHESGLGPLIAGIWSWDEDNTRRELFIHGISRRPEGEGCVDETCGLYLHEHENEEPVLTFTAHIREEGA